MVNKDEQPVPMLFEAGEDFAPNDEEIFVPSLLVTLRLHLR